MKIYRVQKADGSGPYRSGLIEMWLKSSHNGGSHPNAYNDRLLKAKWSKMSEAKQERYKFAFSSMRQLQSWFNKSELKRLKALGFEIKELRVSKRDVIMGSRQVIFKQ
jgi:hypothetical protein